MKKSDEFGFRGSKPARPGPSPETSSPRGSGLSNGPLRHSDNICDKNPSRDSARWTAGATLLLAGSVSVLVWGAIALALGALK
jgi:hypothetical protein